MKAMVTGSKGANRIPKDILVNDDGVVGFGDPVMLASGAVDLDEGDNYCAIFAHESGVVVDITSTKYDTSGVGIAPSALPVPEGQYYFCPGATRINKTAGGKCTVYKSIEH